MLGAGFAEKENLIWKITFEAEKLEFTNFLVQFSTICNVLSPRSLCGCFLFSIQILHEIDVISSARLSLISIINCTPLPHHHHPIILYPCIHFIFYVSLIESYCLTFFCFGVLFFVFFFLFYIFVFFFPLECLLHEGRDWIMLVVILLIK